MKRCLIHLVLVLSAATASAREPVVKELAGDVKKRIDDEYADLEKLYKHLHANPELSLQEENSAKRMADEMKALGWEVTKNVGGHGVVAVLKNGQGPTAMVRTDMDALPVVERTGL